MTLIHTPAGGMRQHTLDGARRYLTAGEREAFLRSEAQTAAQEISVNALQAIALVSAYLQLPRCNITSITAAYELRFRLA